MEKRKHASPQQTIVLHSVQSLAEVVERLRLKPGFRIGKHLGNLEFGRSNYDPDIRTRTYDATYVTSMEIPREVQTTKEPIIYRLYARINLYSIRDDLTKIELKIAIETQWLENWILAIGISIGLLAWATSQKSIGFFFLVFVIIAISVVIQTVISYVTYRRLKHLRQIFSQTIMEHLQCGTPDERTQYFEVEAIS